MRRHRSSARNPINQLVRMLGIRHPNSNIEGIKFLQKMNKMTKDQREFLSDCNLFTYHQSFSFMELRRIKKRLGYLATTKYISQIK